MVRRYNGDMNEHARKGQRCVLKRQINGQTTDCLVHSEKKYPYFTNSDKNIIRTDGRGLIYRDARTLLGGVREDKRLSVVLLRLLVAGWSVGEIE